MLNKHKKATNLKKNKKKMGLTVERVVEVGIAIAERFRRVIEISVNIITGKCNGGGNSDDGDEP